MKSRRSSDQLSLPFERSAPVASPRTAVERPARARPVVPSVGAPAPRAWEPHQLAGEIGRLAGTPVRLRVHDNRSTMISFRREARAIHLRVHHMFLRAGPEVVGALAEYARVRCERSGRLLDDFVRRNRVAIKPADPEKARQRPLRTLGETHDLAALFASINARYFDGAIDARIGWGRGSVARPRRSIRMGAYFHETRTILIHPALDRAAVPRYFVELVVFHEMLHQAVPQQRDAAGRRCVHSPEFRAREREFADFDRARVWERDNLGILLGTKREGVRRRRAD